MKIDFPEIDEQVQAEFTDVTIAHDDGKNSEAHKKKRRFKRVYLQPQPRKQRNRKNRNTPSADDIIEQGWNGIVKNVSGHPISKTEETLLSKGKKFCPVDVDPPIVRMQRELRNFYRKIRIKWHFRGKHDNRTELESKFYQQSSWCPPKASLEIESFIKTLQQKFDSWKPPRWIRDNLSGAERNLLQTINVDQFVYMWEDKGPSFTKMTTDQYISAGRAELDKANYYQAVNSDPSLEIKQQSDILTSRMFQNGEITEKVCEYLQLGGDKLSKYYHLLKTHNIPTELEDPVTWLTDQGFPIRGIISGRGGPTERLAGFIDHFLQPGMKSLKSFLKDTKHTLQLIENINERIDEGELSLEGVSLVSFDVEKMYNNITHEMGRGAAKNYLESRSAEIGGADINTDPFVPTESILEGLDLCTQNNYFEFEKQVYKQTSGVGTGVKLAPPYACLAMGEYENKLFSSEIDEEKQLLEMIILWKRFIDDVFMLFSGSKADCDKLANWCNNIMPGVIKLKCNFSETNLEFLDLRIMIVDGKLETELFVKPTNLQLFLDYESNHPTHCKDAIIYSQALRVIERCSLPGSAESHLESLRGKFLSRKYPENIVDQQFSRAKKKGRKDLIFQKRKEKEKDDKIRLIFTHNSNNPPLHQWIRQAKKHLTTTQGKELGTKFQITTKQPKNLGRLVTGLKDGPKITRQDNPGCFKCNHCKVSCPKMKETKTFSSTNTKKIYKIRDHMDCDSTFVVYLITCNRCRGQYIGKSVTSFKKRHSNHKVEIRNKKGGLGQHYGGQRQCGYQDVSITLIEKVETGNRALLADRELYWQNQLRAFVENGGNAQCIRKDY